MKALQYTEIGAPPAIHEMPIPKPGPGEVLLKVTAAGACHSDLYFMDLPAEEYTLGLPLTLGQRMHRGGRGPWRRGTRRQGG